MLQSVVIMVHVAVALLIIGVVLLQLGKGAEAGTGFGTGASGTVFGARGSSNFLTRLTAVLATLFFVTSLGLAYLAGKQSVPESLLELTLPNEQDAGVIGASDLDAELPVIPSESVD